MADASLSIIMHGNLLAVREAQRMLEQAGIRAAVQPIPGKEGLAALVVAAADAKRGQAAYDASLSSMKAGDRAGEPAAGIVDLDAEETSCPACETKFATKGVTRCPECGLNFGG
jgi:hypothetical protein